MNTIFSNTKNSKTSKPHVLILKFTDKLDFREGENKFLSQILVFITNEKT